MPRRNLENSFKTPPFCCTTESEENVSSISCDVYPGRSSISRPLISLRMMQNIFEKCAETLSRGAIGCCSKIPDLKVVEFVELSNKRTNSVRTIEELLVEFVPQTLKRYFQNLLLKANQQFVEILTTTCIFQSHSIYNISGKVVR